MRNAFAGINTLGMSSTDSFDSRPRYEPSTEFSNQLFSLQTARDTPFKNFMFEKSLGDGFDSQGGMQVFNNHLSDNIDYTKIENNLRQRADIEKHAKILSRHDNLTDNPSTESYLYNFKQHSPMRVDVDGGSWYINSVNNNARKKVIQDHEDNERLTFKNHERSQISQKDLVENAAAFARRKDVLDRMNVQREADKALTKSVDYDRMKFYKNQWIVGGEVNERDQFNNEGSVRNTPVVRNVEDSLSAKPIDVKNNFREDVRDGVDTDVKYDNTTVNVKPTREMLLHDTIAINEDRNVVKANVESNKMVNKEVREEYTGNESFVSKIVNSIKGVFKSKNVTSLKQEQNEHFKMKAPERRVNHSNYVEGYKVVDTRKIDERVNRINKKVITYAILNERGNEIVVLDDRIQQDKDLLVNTIVQVIKDDTVSKELGGNVGFIKTSLFTDGYRATMLQQMKRKDDMMYKVTTVPLEVLYRQFEKIHDKNWVKNLRQMVNNRHADKALNVESKMLEDIAKGMFMTQDNGKVERLAKDIVQVRHILNREGIKANIKSFEDGFEDNYVKKVLVEKSYDGEIDGTNNIRAFNVNEGVKQRGRVGEDKSLNVASARTAQVNEFNVTKQVVVPQRNLRSVKDIMRENWRI